MEVNNLTNSIRGDELFFLEHLLALLLKMTEIDSNRSMYSEDIHSYGENRKGVNKYTIVVYTV